LGRGYSISEVQLPAAFVSKTVRDTDLRIVFGLTLVAIKRGEDVLISPSADEIYKQGDQLVVIGKIEDLDRLSESA